MLPISVCMIMKNEENHIENCLKALMPYQFEIILVDTGSTDNSITLAEKYVSTIHHFTWINDFSAARNYSLSLASNDWILILDCDQTIISLDTQSMHQFMQNHPYDLGLITAQSHYTLNNTDSVYLNQVPRFFNRKHYQYAGKVHELPYLIDRNAALSVTPRSIPIDLTVDDASYSGSPEELKAKSIRDLTLLQEMLETDPDNPYLYFQIGQCYNLIHDDENAAYYYFKGLSLPTDPSAEYVQMMLIGYGYALLHLERYDEALQIKEVYDTFATTADFLCLIGLIYLRTGHYLEAMAEFIKATTFTNYRVEGSNSFIPYYNMGCINELFGDIPHARMMYEKCGNFQPALDRLQMIEH